MKTYRNRILWCITMPAIIFALGFVLSSCKEDEDSTTVSNAKEITAFTFKATYNTALDADVIAGISGTHITVTVPYGTRVTALWAIFTTTGTSVSVGSTDQESGDTGNDFTDPVIYTVTAADGSTRDYTVTVIIAPAPKAITAFSFEAADNTALSSDVTGSISGTGITVSVPFDTEVDALVATFTITGTDVAVDGTTQSSGTTANDFTSPVTYTVTAEDGGTEDYTVTVSIAAARAITSFSFNAVDNSVLSTDQTAIIDEGTHTISTTLPLFGDLDVSALVATFTTNGSSVAVGSTVQTSGTTANDFTSTVIYTVTAVDGSTQDYTMSLYSHQAYIKASNNDAEDNFGSSVSLSGDTLAVGTKYEDSSQTTITNGDTASSDDSSADSGAVYVYQRNGTTWTQEAYLKASNSGARNYFGETVSLSGDTLAVGASREDSNQSTITNGATASADNSNENSGAVYIYTRNDVIWSQQAYLKASNNDASGDYFGISVSLSGDTLVVGAIREDSNQTTITNGPTAGDDNNREDSGAVYVYRRSGTDWTQQAYIKAANSDTSDYFGISVSLSGDTLAVGTFRESSNQTTITNGTTASADNSSDLSGAVYVYQRSGTDWIQQAYIKTSNNDAIDYFGLSVSLSGDSLAVGAYREDSNQITITNGDTASADNSNSLSGAVYVYTRSGAVWAQEAYIKAANNDADDYFGISVSLSGDTLAVGVGSEDSNQTTITNGPTASDDNNSEDSGAVYVYTRNGAVWTQKAYIKAFNNDTEDYFGRSVSLSGDTLAVGAIYEDSNQTSITNGPTASDDDSSTDSGAVYVY